MELHQSRVPYPHVGLDMGEVERYVEGIAGREAVGTWICIYNEKKESFFSLNKKYKESTSVFLNIYKLYLEHFFF